MKGLTIARRYIFFIHRIRIQNWKPVPGWGKGYRKFRKAVDILFYNFSSSLLTNINTIRIIFPLGMKS